MSTADRLAQMLREQPNLCEIRSLTDIAHELGVSRQRIHQLLPKPPRDRREIAAQNRWARLSRVLREFDEQHPGALLPKSFGGWGMEKVSAATGISRNALIALRRACGYPTRGVSSLMTEAERSRWYYANSERQRELKKAQNAQWRAAHPERYREINRAAVRRYKAKRGQASLQHAG